LSWLLGAMGTLLVVGQPSTEAYLHVRSPEIAVDVWLVEEHGERRPMGDGGLVVWPLAVPSGRREVCLGTPWTQPLCRELDLRPGETFVWQVLLDDLIPLPTARCRVALPPRAVGADVVVDGKTHASVQVAWDAPDQAEFHHGIWVEVPVRTAAWIQMTDEENTPCLCRVPSLNFGEEYTCWWDCR